jgi:hypothetical protein
VLSLCRQAIEFAEDDARRGSIELMAAQAAYGMDREQEAVAHAESALALFDDAGLDEAATEAATTLATILLNYRRIDLALELLRPRYEAVGETSGAAALAAAYARAVMMSGNDNEARSAIDAADVALVVAESGRDDALLADALITKGSAFALVGRPREGEILLRGGLDIADRADLTQQRSRAINNLAGLTSEDERQVFDLGRRGLDAAIRSGDAKEIHDWALSYAWYAAFDGDYDEATHVVEEFDVWVDESFGAGSPHLYVAWATGEASNTEELRASVPDISRKDDRVQSASRADTIAGCLFADRRYEDAFSAAMGIEPYPWIDAPQTALAAALLLGDRDRFEQAAAYAAEFPFPGAKRDRFDWLVAAGRAVFDGDTDGAVANFSAAIDQLEQIGLARSLNWHRFVFAAAVGQDVAEARDAARDAHDWILDTGSYGYLEAWKDGLPEQAAEAVG